MENKITLFSTGCPQCKVLKKLLDDRGITYEVCSDVEKMLGMGISSVPMLMVDEDLMNFQSAMKWTKEASK